MRASHAVAATPTLALFAGLVLAASSCGGGAHSARQSGQVSKTVTTPPEQRSTNFGADVSAMFLGRKLDATAVDRQLAAVAGAGLGLVRAAPLWEFTEPLPPRRGKHSYDWRFDDFVARRLAAHSLKWIAVIAYAPAWASVEPSELHAAPRAPADFAAYAGALATRYRGQIAAYEIWNEENSPIFWRPGPDPAAYAELYLAARAAIHRADPGVPVLIGGLANDTPFLPELLAIPGVAGQIDGVAVHPYDSGPLQVVAKVRAYRLQLRSLGVGNLPLYVTEYGWATLPISNPTYAPASEQGPFIGEVARVLLRSDCNVRAVIFYAWTTAQGLASDRDQWYGITPPSVTTTPATASVASAARDLLVPRGATVPLCGS